MVKIKFSSSQEGLMMSTVICCHYCLWIYSLIAKFAVHICVLCFGGIVLHTVESGVMCLLRLSDLVMRFEVPDSRNRWDSPVFTVHAAGSVPFDQVHQVLYHRPPAPPNLSTLPVSSKHLQLNNITDHFSVVWYSSQSVSLVCVYVFVYVSRQ